MSPQKLLPNIIKYQKAPLEIGQMEKQLTLLQQKEDIDVMKYPIKQIQIQENHVYMQGLVLKNNQKTLRDKLINSELNIQGNSVTNSIKILGVEKISKDQVLKPWWNELFVEKSKKLWYPKEIDLQDVDLNSLNCSSPFTTHNLLLQTQKQQTQIKNSQINSMFILEDIIEKENGIEYNENDQDKDSSDSESEENL